MEFDLADFAPEKFSRSNSAGSSMSAAVALAVAIDRLLEILRDGERHTLREFLPVEWDGDEAARVVTSRALGRLIAAGLARKPTRHTFQITAKGRLTAPELIDHAKFREELCG